MVEVARTTQNMIPAMLDAVRAEATLGEICNALRERVGRLPRARALLTAAVPGADGGFVPGAGAALTVGDEVARGRPS